MDVESRQLVMDNERLKTRLLESNIEFDEQTFGARVQSVISQSNVDEANARKAVILADIAEKYGMLEAGLSVEMLAKQIALYGSAGRGGGGGRGVSSTALSNAEKSIEAAVAPIQNKIDLLEAERKNLTAGPGLDDAGKRRLNTLKQELTQAYRDLRLAYEAAGVVDAPSAAEKALGAARSLMPPGMALGGG
jgi:hypothetical protein